MADVLVFIPQHELTASANMAEFIRMCREDLTLFGPNLDWSNSVWREAKVTFGNIDQSSVIGGVTQPLAQPFCDFAKAYFRYRHTHAPNEHKAELRALKCVERALIEQTDAADPSTINISVLDAAAQIARNCYEAPYAPGREIARLAQFLAEHRLVAHSLDWKSPIRRPIDTVRTGAKAKERREAKLPDPEAVHAIASIFARGPTHAADIFVTSAAAMLLCAPSRISEILELHVDCEVEERKRDGSTAYGWAFRPKKGGAPMIKWIPAPMVDIAKLSIARLREISAPAREFARWVESGDTHSFPGFSAHAGVDGLLSRTAIKELIGKFRSLKGLQFQKAGSFRMTTVANFSAWLRAEVIRENRFFPYISKDKVVKFSDNLFCFKQNQIAYSHSSVELSLWRPNNNSLNDKLTDSLEKASASFFDRHGFNAGREHRLKVTSHQFRHLITTFAHRGGLPSSEIARWRGSKDVKQNRAYDHRSEFELVAMLREHDPTLVRSKSELEIAEQIKAALPMTTAEFNALEKPTAHITEFGFCIHDFVMSPCQRFRDCLSCTEQVCVKGDGRLQGLRQQLELVEKEMEKAKEGAAEGAYGADPWTRVQSETHARLQSLIEIMQDPEIPDGSIIRIANPKEFSPARRALIHRGYDQIIQPRLPSLGAE
ncbi:hypothetical protein SAMN05428974_1513 [Sphingopyxis sp. YR583]|uniref:integrase n=1 Tax=Sphingopyxis sp. YR583 TaxID=1881047 RepID=UPI0008A780D2|nr:integrase [Sphingopyxis sp. YR583]SEH15758.1 hypothetical protein SAMN05428974_1513 [Sphingopyxis sp. YR583]